MLALREIQDDSPEREKILKDLEGTVLRCTENVKIIISKIKPKNKNKSFKKQQENFANKNHTLDGFRKIILPVIERYSDSDETFKTTGSKLASLFGDIFVRQFSIAEDFLENRFHEEVFEEDGDYDYFVAKYGQELGAAILLYTSYFIQPTVKGSEPQKKSRAEIDEDFSFTNQLNEKQKKLLAEIVYQFLPDFTEKYIDSLLEAIELFTEKGKSEYIDYYLKIGAVGVGDIKYNSKAGVFPFFNIPKVFEEFQYMDEMGGLQEEIFNYSILNYRKTGGRLTFSKKPSKTSPKKALIRHVEDGKSTFYSKFSICLFVDLARRYGYGEDKIKELLDLPFKHEKIRFELADVVLAIFGAKNRQNFNLEPAIDFLNETHSYVHNPTNFNQYFLNDIVRLSEKNQDKFWPLAKRVVKQLRDTASEFGLFYELSPSLNELYQNDFPAFEKEVLEMMNFVYKFSIRISADVSRNILKFYLLYNGQPKFEEFLNGLRLILKRAAEFMDRDEHKRHEKNKAYQESLDLRVKFAFFGYMQNCLNVDENGKRIAVEGPSQMNQETEYMDLAQGCSYSAFDHVTPGDVPDNFEELRRKEEFLRELFFKNSGFDEEQVSGILKVSDLTEEIEFDGNEERVADLRTALNGLPEGGENVNFNLLLKRIRSEAMAVLEVRDWRSIMGFSSNGKVCLSHGEEGLNRDSWIYRANPSTQLAASSGALFLAMGFAEFSDDLFELNIPDGILEPLGLEEEFETFKRGEIGMREILEAVRKKNLEGILRKNIQRALPFVAEAIQNERTKSPGLMSIGSKIESRNSLKDEDFNFVLELGGFGDIRHTPFQLKHAGRSLVNPPLPSALEEKLLAYLFIMFGTVDPANIDMQVTVGGRLSNKNAGIVCASNILASDVAVQYSPTAFTTNNWDDYTDRRIMVYDMGVRSKSLPFDLPNAEGRTDKVGCKSLSDLKLMQVLGTFAVHRQFGGHFAGQFDSYRSDFMDLLKEHGLITKFEFSRWVVDSYQVSDAPVYHDSMVRAFTEARRDNDLLVAQTRVLIARQLQSHLKENRERIIEENPEEFEKLKVY